MHWSAGDRWLSVRRDAVVGCIVRSVEVAESDGQSGLQVREVREGWYGLCGEWCTGDVSTSHCMWATLIVHR